MKNFFILLMVVLMLAGLASTTFAKWNGIEVPPNCEEDCDGPIRDGWL